MMHYSHNPEKDMGKTKISRIRCLSTTEPVNRGRMVSQGNASFSFLDFIKKFAGYPSLTNTRFVSLSISDKQLLKLACYL